MINIDSDQGRIGELWWINSDLQPEEQFMPAIIGILDLGSVVKVKLIRWGTCGYGRNIRIGMEQLDD